MTPNVYRIVAVDGTEETETLLDLHRATLGAGCPVPSFDEGFWWIAYKSDEPAAFAGLVPSTQVPRWGYLIRCGVTAPHVGHGLQRRLIHVRERKARSLGWTALVTDTTHNVPSANNLIRCGYRLFTPAHPYSFKDALYWRKEISSDQSIP